MTKRRGGGITRGLGFADAIASAQELAGIFRLRMPNRFALRHAPLKMTKLQLCPESSDDKGFFTAQGSFVTDIACTHYKVVIRRAALFAGPKDL